MKRFLTLLALALLGFHIAISSTGCQSGQGQAQTYHTLKATALAGQAAIDAAAILRTEGKMTPARWKLVAHHYDHVYLPALRAAIEGANGDQLDAPPLAVLGALGALQSLASNR